MSIELLLVIIFFSVWYAIFLVYRDLATSVKGEGDKLREIKEEGEGMVIRKAPSVLAEGRD